METEKLTSKNSPCLSPEKIPQQDRSSLDSQLREIDLRNQIQSLVIKKDEFGDLLRKVKKYNLPQLKVIYLSYPEVMLKLENILLKNIIYERLTPKDPLFKRLNETIKYLDKLSGLTEEAQQAVQEIKKIYENYINRVCLVEGKERIGLIKGFARFQTLEGTYLMKQTVGRKLISWGKFGPLRKKNLYGSSIVEQVGGIHSKKTSTGDGLNPGKEYAIDLLKYLILQAGGTPTEIGFVENVFYRKADGREFGDNPIKIKARELIQQSQGATYNDILELHPSLKKDYPFIPTREASVVQISLSVEGENFFDLLSKEESVLKPKISNFTTVMILDALVGASDSRADNFMYRKGELICIDQDHGLDAEVFLEGEHHFLGIKSILFCLPEMDESPDHQVLSFLSNIEPAEILIEWLDRIEEKSKKYARLKEEKVLKDQEFEENHFPFLIPDANVLPRLYHLLKTIKQVAMSQPKNHWEILEKIFPVLSMCMKKVRDQTGGHPIKAQDMVFGWDSLAMAKIDQVPLEKFLSPDEFQTIIPYLSREKGPSESKSLPDNIGQLLWDHPTSYSLLSQLISLTFMYHIPIHDSNITDDQLESLLKKMIQVKGITLYNCPKITSHGLSKVLNLRPNLMVFLGTCPLIKKKESSSPEASITEEEFKKLAKEHSNLKRGFAFQNARLNPPIPLTMPEAMEGLLWTCPTSNHLLTQVAPLTYLTHLPIHDSEITDQQLDSILRKMPHLKGITLYNCHLITASGIRLAIEHRKDLTLVLGNCASLDGKGLKEIAEDCCLHNQRLLFQVDPVRPPIIVVDKVKVAQEQLNEGFVWAVFGKQKSFADAFYLLGADPNAPINLTAFELFLQREKGIANQGFASGMSVMHLTITEKLQQELEYLLSLNHPLPKLTGKGTTPLHLAARLGNLEAVKAIHEAGHSLEQGDSEGMTPLLWAVKGQQPQVYKYLVNQKVNVLGLTKDKKGVLHLACEAGPAEVINYFLGIKDYKEKLATQLIQSDEMGRQPIHYAVYGEETPDVVELLIEKKVDLSPIDLLKKTPLHEAFHYKKIKTALLLIEAGANLTLRNADNETPLDVAVSHGHFDLLPYLLNLELKSEEHSNIPLPADPMAFYKESYIKAKTQGDIGVEILCLDKLGALILKEHDKVPQVRDWEGAAHHFNSAVNLALSDKFTGPYKQAIIAFLFRRLEMVEAIYIRDQTKSLVSKRNLTLTQDLRNYLHDTRQEVRKALIEKTEIHHLLETLSKGYELVLKELAKEAIARLGTPPTEWSLFGMGELARGEICPYSGVQYGLLIGDNLPATKRYFDHFLRLLGLMILNIGETPAPFGQEEQSVHCKGFRRSETLFQPFMGTPELLLDKQRSWQQSHNTAGLYRTLRPIVSSSLRLFSIYEESFNKEFKGLTGFMGLMGPSKTRERGISFLKGFVNDYKLPSLTKEGNIQSLDFHKHLIVAFEMMIEGLTLFYDLPSRDCISRVEDLFNMKIFNIDARNNVRAALELLYRLRLALHFDAGMESNELSNERPKESLRQKTEVFEELKPILQVLISLHIAVQVIVDSNGKLNPFDKNRLSEKDLTPLFTSVKNNSNSNEIGSKSDKQ